MHHNVGTKCFALRRMDLAGASDAVHALQQLPGNPMYVDNKMAQCPGNAAGASFFYEAGDVPYEAQEVRAYGLLLHDLVSRLRQADDHVQSEVDTVKLLQEVVEVCNGKTSFALQRPTFSVVLKKLTSRMSV